MLQNPHFLFIMNLGTYNMIRFFFKGSPVSVLFIFTLSLSKYKKMDLNKSNPIPFSGYSGRRQQRAILISERVYIFVLFYALCMHLYLTLFVSDPESLPILEDEQSSSVVKYQIMQLCRLVTNNDAIDKIPLPGGGRGGG